MDKYSLIDLSAGGIHHSWEENKEECPLGNIIYEVQLDVMDPYCTIRAFDQGKIKDDGTIREIHVNDYFQFLDTNTENNTIDNLRRTQNGERLLQTSHYSLDILEITDRKQDKTINSFHHFYVREGDVDIATAEAIVRVTQGHSCLVPQHAGDYSITARVPGSVLLKTFI